MSRIATTAVAAITTTALIAGTLTPAYTQPINALTCHENKCDEEDNPLTLNPIQATVINTNTGQKCVEVDPQQDLDIKFQLPTDVLGSEDPTQFEFWVDGKDDRLTDEIKWALSVNLAIEENDPILSGVTFSFDKPNWIFAFHIPRVVAEKLDRSKQLFFEFEILKIYNDEKGFWVTAASLDDTENEGSLTVTLCKPTPPPPDPPTPPNPPLPPLPPNPLPRPTPPEKEHSLAKASQIIGAVAGGVLTLVLLVFLASKLQPKAAPAAPVPAAPKTPAKGIVKGIIKGRPKN